jgi:hypothetical protein
MCLEEATDDADEGATDELDSFEEWKENPSEDTELESVKLLSALVYGRLIIQSTRGSQITLETDYYVDSAGMCSATAKLDMPSHQVIDDGGDVAHPSEPVVASFFQADKACVGEQFRIMTRNPHTKQGIIAMLGNVSHLRIEPKEAIAG